MQGLTPWPSLSVDTLTKKCVDAKYKLAYSSDLVCSTVHRDVVEVFEFLPGIA